jgi:hypothetical protein
MVLYRSARADEKTPGCDRRAPHKSSIEPARRQRSSNLRADPVRPAIWFTRARRAATQMPVSQVAAKIDDSGSHMPRMLENITT